MTVAKMAAIPAASATTPAGRAPGIAHGLRLHSCCHAGFPGSQTVCNFASSTAAEGVLFPAPSGMPLVRRPSPSARSPARPRGGVARARVGAPAENSPRRPDSDSRSGQP